MGGRRLVPGQDQQNPRGNFPGLYSPDSGAILPNITAQYDLYELLANRDKLQEVLRRRGELATQIAKLEEDWLWNQAAMDAALGVDGEEEFTIYLAPVGRIPARGE